MNKSKLFVLGLLGCMMLVGGVACSGSDGDAVVEPEPPVDNGVKTRRLTITQVDDATSREDVTRATLSDDGTTLGASWKADDRLTYCNISWPMLTQGTLKAATTAATSQFTGDVSCHLGDRLAVVYPATTFEDIGYYTISLTGQNGTLDKVATNFHYVMGIATVTSVTETTATATIGKMKSLLTLCKFSFKDKATEDVIPVSTLEISFGGTGSDANKYPQSATVSFEKSTPQADVHAVAADVTTAPLSITLPSAQDEVYVALMPTTNVAAPFKFTVTNSSGTYMGTANAVLKEGEYVVATGLKLTKQ